ncbi:hypothetical protein [Polymorphum gilvum]|uniref:Uncharacterized protein n=1 Tax=Polymorphum gilvum (strain LMG 25793 / CGMCC 1.9160 / SL003B-26A1) TaxID=991905 RepID=F2J3L6_POLGS|nr:hypothetical protein [Polymorphum gilvum]ADZ72152.1 hypothetical protein SL003B_3731 [Polymorphum gilvum SL003B-26A1]
MQLTIETTTTTATLFAAGQSGSGQGKAAATRSDAPDAPAVSALQAAAEKAEEDAVVIAALQAAVDKGKGRDDDEDGALATVEDYRKAAGQLKAALGEDEGGAAASAAYESATVTRTTVEGEIGGQTISASFVSFERVSYDSATGLSARSASALDVEVSGNGVTSVYQGASVSSLYAGTGSQLGNLLSGIA